MLSEAELAIVRDILRSHLPPGIRAWVFGSRANGSARRYSDLDVALEGDCRLGPDLLGDVAEALAESDLPYKSDVIDLQAVEPSFRAIIEPDLIALPY
jgi:uncharacterized protein